MLAVTPVAAVFVLGGPLGRVGSVAYIGISLLLQVARGDGGCEVMTIPGILFAKRTHLMCIIMSPVDWLEHWVAARRKPRVTQRHGLNPTSPPYPGRRAERVPRRHLAS